MIVSRPAFAAAAFAMLCIAGTAWAQTDDAAAGAPQSLGTSNAAPPAADQAPPIAVPMVPAGGVPPPAPIAVTPLGIVDGPAVGLLDDASDGLGAQMWSESDRAELETALSRIPAATADPVVRALARRLLLTQAEAPTGPGQHALITIRLKRLLNAGMIDDAGALASIAALPNDAEFARVQAEALLYANRAADVCTDKTATRMTGDDPLWLQLRAYCYTAAGNGAAADLTRGVMAAKDEDDAAFDALLDGSKAPPPAVAHPTAVDVFLLRQANLPVSGAMAATLGTPANLLAARDLRNAPEDRLAAAERIASTGALDAEELASVADAQVFTDAQKADALTEAGKLSFFSRQALLRQAAARENRPLVRLGLIKRADPTLNERGPFHVFTALEAGNVASLRPDPTLGGLSVIAARALALGGQADVAAGWIGSPSDADMAQAGLALDIASPTPDRDAVAAADITWLAAHATASDRPASSALGLEVWQALGHPLPADVAPVAAALATQQFSGDAINLGQAQTLDAAVSRRGRRGEAVLMILDTIGPHGPAHLEPWTVAHLVSALQKLGLGDSARALAVEALLLGPPPPAASVAVPAPSAAAP
jgi:hypothetical protein